MPWLCIKCKRRVIKTSKALECESCKEWMHIRCGIDITPLQYNQVTAGTLDFHWTCQDCASQQHMKPGAPTDALPQLPSLIRQTNKLRQRNRPPNPTTLDFTVIDDVIPPGFLQEDIKTPGSRHMIFYTEHQLQLLRVAREWYVDGTFRCVGLPFQQLWSIHAFINQNQSTKQVPLVFVLMSGRSAADYTAVLEKILEKIPGRPSVLNP